MSLNAALCFRPLVTNFHNLGSSYFSIMSTLKELICREDDSSSALGFPPTESVSPFNWHSLMILGLEVYSFYNLVSASVLILFLV